MSNNNSKSDRKVISLEKTEGKRVNLSKPDVSSVVLDENNQRVCYPVNSAKEEIHPKSVEPKVAFPTGNKNSEEILPRQLKQESDPVEQRICYPKGSYSEEEVNEKTSEAEVKLKTETKEQSDLSKYHNYGQLGNPQHLQKYGNPQMSMGGGCNNVKRNRKYFNSTFEAILEYSKITLLEIFFVALTLVALPDLFDMWLKVEPSSSVTTFTIHILRITLILRLFGAVMDISYIGLPAFRFMFDNMGMQKFISSRARKITEMFLD